MNQSFIITGQLVEIRQTQQISDRFQKREFIIKTNDGKHDQEIMFELQGNKVDIIEDHYPQDEVTLHFNIRGRRQNNPNGYDRIFNTLVVFKIE